ncbi:unnamed protein product [Ectocarpus sp. 4 AP-2014]
MHDYDNDGWRLLHIDDDIIFNEYDQDYFVNVFCLHASTRQNLAQALDNFNFPCITDMALEVVYSWV